MRSSMKTRICLQSSSAGGIELGPRQRRFDRLPRQMAAFTRVPRLPAAPQGYCRSFTSYDVTAEFFGRLNTALTWLDVGVPCFATQLGTP
jgi:hypothetical protein